MKRILLTLLVTTGVYMLMLPPEARAMDPATTAVLAPIAIQVAKEASPHIIRGMKHLLVGLVDIGKDTIDIFRLPVGFFQATFFGPWYFYDGLKNLIKGGIAPFKLCFDALLLPVRPFGAIM